MVHDVTREAAMGTHISLSGHDSNPKKGTYTPNVMSKKNQQITV